MAIQSAELWCLVNCGRRSGRRLIVAAVHGFASFCLVVGRPAIFLRFEVRDLHRLGTYQKTRVPLAGKSPVKFYLSPFKFFRPSVDR